MLQSSDPAPGAILATSPPEVTLSFGERPDPKLSTIKVLDTSGASVTSGPTAAAPDNALALTVPLKPLVGGVYTVAWRSVSAVDSHLATGSFAFMVGTAPPSAGAAPIGGPVTAGSPGVSASAIVGRWLLYIGLLGLLGAAFFGVLVTPSSATISRRVLPLAWVIAAAGTATVLAVQISDAGVELGQIFETSFGVPVVERVVPVLIAGIAVLLVARVEGRRRVGLAVVAIAAAGSLLADVLSSHAAAGHNVALDVLVQSIHVLAVGLWLGGLVGLLVTIRRDPDALTARAAKLFSRIATVGIGTVVASGVVRAIAEIGTIDRLVSSDFGRLVIAKSALLGLLAVLGGVNHFRNVPAAGHVLRGLRRIGSAELLVGVTVLLLSASLVNVAPPSSVAAADPSPAPSPSLVPLIVDGHDFGTSVRVRLEVSPGTAGINTFRATVTDYDSGAPVTADGVSLRFTIPARSDVGSSQLDLVPAGLGVFGATGGNVSLEGAWQVTALIAQGIASVEVPLQMITRTAPPSIDVNAVAGLPTIYSVHLSVGRTIQVYLDPGHAGANEVHATFFDATGTELPVPSVELALGSSGGGQGPLTARQLEPGHFVADVTLAAGIYTVSISGPAPGGDQLTTQLDLGVSK